MYFLYILLSFLFTIANSFHNYSLTPTQFQFSKKKQSLLKKLRSVNESISSNSDSRVPNTA